MAESRGAVPASARLIFMEWGEHANGHEGSLFLAVHRSMWCRNQSSSIRRAQRR